MFKPKEVSHWNGQQNILLEDLNWFNGAPTSPLVQIPDQDT